MQIAFYIFFRSENWKKIVTDVQNTFANWSQIILVIIHHKHKCEQTVLEVPISTFVYLHVTFCLNTGAHFINSSQNIYQEELPIAAHFEIQLLALLWSLAQHHFWRRSGLRSIEV